MYYFNDMKGCVLTGLVFCLITLVGSIISSHFTEIWYGAGLVVGSFAGWTVAYGRLQWMEKHLDVHIFCNGHLLKKKKGDCPSPKVFEMCIRDRCRSIFPVISLPIGKTLQVLTV